MPATAIDEHLAYVCTHPGCDLAPWAYGLRGSELLPRSAAAQEQTEPPPDDPGQGHPCPLCRRAFPPRTGRLLAVPIAGPLRDVVSAMPGPTHQAWALAESAEALGHAAHDAYSAVVEFVHAPKGSAAPSGLTPVLGRKIVTGQVLRARPYDGHTLAFLNQDAQTQRAGAKKTTAVPLYGIVPAAPLPTSRAEPTYIRELQRDLILLGYYSRSRGSRTVGLFDSHTLGPVLALKEDLVDLYGVPVTSTLANLPSGPVDSDRFAAPIYYQQRFSSPVRIIRDWHGAVGLNNKRTGRLGQRVTGFSKALHRLSETNDASRFLKRLDKVEAELARLQIEIDALPSLFVLLDPRALATPFDPTGAPAGLSAASLAPLPPGTSPDFASVKAMLGDSVWSTKEFNPRRDNAASFAKTAKRLDAKLGEILDRAEASGVQAATVTAPASATPRWLGVQEQLRSVTQVVTTVASLMQFWLRSLPKQVQAWFEHIRLTGIVDPATAVYIKAMLQGARIGPRGKIAYRPAVDVEDFGSQDEGATYLRQTLRDRPDNRGRSRAATMPEILALQFYVNESGMRFTSSLRPYHVVPEDARTRFVKVGIDAEVHPKRGTFDLVFATASPWVHARGWGLGQETESTRKDAFGGFEVVRGMPLVRDGATHIEHPSALADRDASFSSVLEHKALSRFNNRKMSRRINCSYGEWTDKPYYDCHGCLKRFFDLGLVGDRKSGRGGVFIPEGSGTFGDPGLTQNVWVDLERVTAFSRANGATEDLGRRDFLYRDLFGLDTPPPEVSEAALAVLRTEGKGGVKIDARCKAVATDRGIDADALVTEVKQYIAARRQLPCSWLRVRIGYSGSGAQAWGSVMNLLHIVGNLDAKKKTLRDHIVAASELRVSEAE